MTKAKKQKKSDEKLLEEARKRFKAAAEFESDNRDLYVEDVEFLHIEQWPEKVKREREAEGRPCLTRNRLPAFVGQLISDARQNSPTIQVHPVDDSADPKVAEIYEGLIRQIEYQSRASQAYDTALEHAASGGIGAFRFVTQYSDDSGFEQDIAFKRITNPLTVHVDPNADEYDKSDARWMFVSEMVTEDEFEERWPDAEKKEWGEGNRGEDVAYWFENKRIRVAEYWVKEPCVKKLALLSTGETIDITDKPVPEGMSVERERSVRSHKVMRYVLSGDQVLEGPQEWPGKYIPIVMVYGPEVHIQGKVYYRSVHRYAKDAQRMYNYWSTVIAEKLALTPKAPYIGTTEQFEGLEHYWAAANTENRAYLPYNSDANAPGRPQRDRPADVNSGEIQASQQCVDDMKATMGIFDASLGAQGNETSGRAILARQREGDAATFPWIDNLGRSVEYAGRILVDLIPKIYDSERVVRVLGIDDSEEFVEINTMYMDPTTGMTHVVNDLSVGKFDVTISTGPSYQTQRLESADSMLQFVQAVPIAGQVSGDLIAKNMDWPGADEFARRLKKLLPPGMLDPDDEDAPPPPQPDPMQQLEMAEKEQKIADGQQEMAKRQIEMDGKSLDNAQKQLQLAAQSGSLEALIEQRVQQVLLSMFRPPPQQVSVNEPGQAPGFFTPE